MPKITGRSNGLITEMASLKEKKYRAQTGLFLIHGKKLLREAIRSGLDLKYVFYTGKNADLAESAAASSGAALYETDEYVFSKLTDEQAPEGICAAAVIPARKHRIEDGAFVLICDRLSDPGNAGTVLRSARAFGAGTVVFSSDCADIYSPKVVRGAMGASFAENIITGADTVTTVEELRKRGFRTYAAALHTDAVPLSSADLSGGCAVVIGSEGRGLPENVINACENRLFIEMDPSCESLNAAVAASVIMYKRFAGDL